MYDVNVKVYKYLPADPPSISNVMSSSKSSYIGQEVTFTCAADGNPLPFYSWKTPDNQTLTGSTLVVKLQSSREFGVYACITNNVHGKSTRNITLQQLCKYPVSCNFFILFKQAAAY